MRKITILFLLINQLSIGQNYIQIVKTDINIRMSPTTSSTIVGHAFFGEIYETNGENEKWYSVILPSGKTRWIYKTLVKKTEFTPVELIKLNINQIQEEIYLATDNAEKDSNSKIIDDLDRAEINDILYDRYNLIVMQKYSLNPAQFESVLNYIPPSRSVIVQPVAEHLVSVSHVDYDLFKIDFENFYVQTKRCFKLGSALDAMIYMYYDDENYFIQKLCFEDGYGKGFNNCYNIKNIFKSVIDEKNLVVLTDDGKIKKTSLVLKETKLNLPD